MSKKLGYKGKVTVGSNSVVAGIGTWSINGVKSDQIDISSFGDEWKQYAFGMKDGGEISFDGFFDPEDAAGQEILRQANLYNSALTTLKLWIDNKSYFMPCQTTGYFSPTLTTGAPTKASYVNITGYDVKKDMSTMDKCTFSGKVSGVMVLV